MRIGNAVPVVLSVALAACASAGAGGSSDGGGRNLITAAEIERTTVSTAYEVVQRLRPQWLFDRGAVSMRNAGPEGAPTTPSGDPGREGPVIFVDGTRMGDLQMLRNIPADNVQQIRFLSARDATTKYGTGYPYGVIEVMRR